MLLKSPEHDLLCLCCENRAYKEVLEELVRSKTVRNKRRSVNSAQHDRTTNNYCGDQRYYPGKKAIAGYM